MLYIIAFVALKTNAERCRRAVKAFDTSEEQSRHKFTTPFTERSSALDYVAESHDIMETETPLLILVQYSKPFLIAHPDEPSLLRESQVLPEDHSPISVQIHGIEEVMRHPLYVFGPALVVGVSYLSHFLHSFHRPSFLPEKFSGSPRRQSD